MNKYYVLNNNEKATANKMMDNSSVENLWSGFTLKKEKLKITPTDAFVFSVGNAEVPRLEKGKEYALLVNADGISVAGKDYGGLMRGFFSLLMKIECCDGTFKIKHTEEQSAYLLSNRMIHICVFPENDLYFIKKLIRLSALCQYTHIIIEFWGMLKYDCMKELSWPRAFTKDEAGELIRECRELGIEPIPMFNQLGHAPQSRMCFGKHVVLDQNPSLQHLFTPDGWAWNIESEEVKALLKKIRCELYELFGDGEYIHIGFDEAYSISGNKELNEKLPQFLASLTSEVENEGRRPMIWMDMLLEKNNFKNCYSNGVKDKVEFLRNSTAKSTVFVDWQYSCTDIPIPSLASLKNSGRDVMGAPWFEGGNQFAHVKTINEQELFGIMLTTWHTLNEKIPSVLGCAKHCGAVGFYWSRPNGLELHVETATLLRRISFEGNSYEECGWSKNQIEV